MYKLIEGDSPQEVESKVIPYLDSGWETAGPCQVTSCVLPAPEGVVRSYCQTLIKPKEETANQARVHEISADKAPITKKEDNAKQA